VSELSSAHLSCTDIRDFEPRGLGPAFAELATRCRFVRAFGDFWSHMLVAEGSIDVAVEPIVNPWDIAAIQVIVEEAGGRFSDFAGVSRIDSGCVITSNGILHDDVLELMRPQAE
jgi:histidinol-phosphatase